MSVCTRTFFFSVFILLAFSAQSIASITGTVTDTQSYPVSGALVTFTDESNTKHTFSVYTDSSGKYEIDVITSVEDGSPTPFLLDQNYPNPFNPTTTIPFTLDISGTVSLTIYNIMGQHVRTLLNTYMQAGLHNVVWDGMDELGNHVSSGVYLYQLRNGNHTESKKMLLLDGGSFGTITSPTYENRSPKRTAETNPALYTVTVERFLYETLHLEHVDPTSSATLDFTMQDDGLMVIIPGGTFQMGDVEGEGLPNELPVHTVTVSTFEMSKYEITNSHYVRYLNAALNAGDISVTSGNVYGNTGEWSGKIYIDVAHKITYINGSFHVSSAYENWPVVAVTWYGAKAFTDYYGIDLPREAEWEYASRCGDHQYMYGTVDGMIDSSKANYNYGEHIGHPVSVGSYPANPFGLHDMSGNVGEWCADWYSEYTSESATDPTGALSGTSRVERGGYWICPEEYCRSALRFEIDPYTIMGYLGFRIARRPAQ